MRSVPARATTAAVALAMAGCAVDGIVPGTPKAVAELAIAPYEVHEECAQLAVGDRLDYRFDAKAPVTFNLYYKSGTMFLSPISRDHVMEASGVFRAQDARRYCLRWEAGQQGAILDYRIRLLRAETPQ